MYLNSVIVFCIATLVFQVHCSISSEYEVDYEANFEHEKNAHNTFDYIVVGVGQAGSVAAARYHTSRPYQYINHSLFRLAEVRNSNGHGFKYSVLISFVWCLCSL